MDDAVEDGVGIGGIANKIVPFLDARLSMMLKWRP